MTNKLEKCPNCGHKFKDGEKYCPNCDLFVPIDDNDDSVKGFNLNETRPFNKFNESDIKEPNEGESLFKHRTKNRDEPHETKSEQIDESKTTQDGDSVEKEASSSNDSNQQKQNQLNSKDDDLSKDENNQSDTKTTQEKETAELTPLPIKPDETQVDNANEDAPLLTRSENTTITSQKDSKKKWLIGIIILIIVVVLGGILYSTQKKKSEEADRVALVTSLTNEIDGLYLTKDHDYLKSGITQSDINKASDALKELKTKKGYDTLKESFDVAEDKFKKQEAVNALFNKPIIEGNQLADNVYVKDDSAVSLNKATKETDGFYKLYNEAIDEANSQKEELKQVAEKVTVVFKEDKVVETATREEYQAAKDAVDGLKNDELKNTYNAELKQVDTFLSEKEEKEAAEAAAREEEQKNAAALQEKQQAANNSSNNTTSSSGSSNSSSTYRWGNRQDATIDLSNPAWTWGPGIQNEVISEVIKRGYVVEGGYTLVPKYIENGEGFYDLYATTNSKIFPNSKPSEFPLFVVTINDKTGSFYGNGPN